MIARTARPTDVPPKDAGDEYPVADSIEPIQESVITEKFSLKILCATPSIEIKGMYGTGLGWQAGKPCESSLVLVG
jgi:hypothetical protein